MQTSRSSRILRAVLYVAILSIAGGIAYSRYADHHKSQLSDAYDYVSGLRAFLAGGDAYGVAPGRDTTGFIYAPLVLEVAAGLCRILPHVLLWRTYLAMLIASALVTPWLLSCIAGGRQGKQSRWFSAPVAAAIFVAEPHLYTVKTMLSGTISAFLYALVLAAAAFGTATGSWVGLYVAVYLTALVKPPFLAFLLLPLLAAERQTLRVVATAIAVALTYWLQRVVTPHLYADFRESLRIELIVHEDYGRGLFGLIHEHTYTRFGFMQWKGSLLAHAVIMGLLVAAFWAGRQLRHRPEIASLWIPSLVVLSMLANPRPLWYDLYAGWPMAVFVMVEWLRTAGSRRERWVGTVCLAVFLGALAVDDWPMTDAGSLLAALLLMVHRIWRLRRPAMRDSARL